MYLLDTQQVMDLFSRNQERPIFKWLSQNRPGESDLFASVLSFGQIAHAIEGMEGPSRNQWRRLHQEGRRRFEELGGIINVDGAIVDVWHSDLRGDRLAGVQDAGGILGEDDRLIIATAIARGYALVTQFDAALAAIAERTTLILIEP